MPPRPPNHQQHHYNPGAVAYNVVEALRNPYGIQPMNQFQNPYSAHYANAYMQQAMYTTPEGYTLSSTYNPYVPSPRNIPPPATSTLKGKGKPVLNRENGIGPRSSQQHGSWYQPGNSRCTKCSFTGSSKSLEIHMMDRHLIYPPGFDKKKESSWDADISLKGKPIPIQGTSLVLNTPEAVEAWLEERRKRWPTVKRVEEKTTKMEEAIARGQLPLRGIQSGGKKRQHEEGQTNQRGRKRRNHGDKLNIREGSRSSGFVQAAPREIQAQKTSTPGSLPLVVRSSLVPSLESDDDGDDSAPEVVSSKPPQQSTSIVETPEPPAINTGAVVPPKRNNQNQAPKHRAREPRLPPRNPFASRPTLLRNLLLPEIRMTVSNLSQAIRFLVDNDLLRDVELKPGQANEKLIEVVESYNLAEST